MIDLKHFARCGILRKEKSLYEIMGRYPYSLCKKVEECKDIDVFWLKRHDYFCGFKRGGIEWKNALVEVIGSMGIEVSVLGEKYVRLSYTQTMEHTGFASAKPCDSTSLRRR